MSSEMQVHLLAICQSLHVRSSHALSTVHMSPTVCPQTVLT